MSRAAIAGLILAGVFALSGCGGNGLLRTQGRLLKDGEEFVPGEGEYIKVTFVPLPPDKKPALNYYFAEVDQESGTFTAAGAQLQGMPPGKYRVAVELIKDRNDQFGGRFDTDRSPFVFDIDKDTEELVLELDKPPAV